MKEWVQNQRQYTEMKVHLGTLITKANASTYGHVSAWWTMEWNQECLKILDDEIGAERVSEQRVACSSGNSISTSFAATASTNSL